MSKNITPIEIHDHFWKILSGMIVKKITAETDQLCPHFRSVLVSLASSRRQCGRSNGVRRAALRRPAGLRRDWDRFQVKERCQRSRKGQNPQVSHKESVEIMARDADPPPSRRRAVPRTR